MSKKQQNVMEANLFVEMIGDAKLSNYKLFKTHEGKVNYLVTEGNAHLFETSKYAKIFDQLRICEEKLVEPLEFDVQISFIALEALYNFYNEHEIEKLAQNLSTGMFMLINDLSHSYTNMSSEELADKYLYMNNIKKLKEFYAVNYMDIVELFNHNYSSIPLFEIIYLGKSSCVYSNFAKLLTDEDVHPATKRIAGYMVCEFANIAPTLVSSREKEEYYYEISYANKHVDMLERYIQEENNPSHSVEGFCKFLTTAL